MSTPAESQASSLRAKLCTKSHFTSPQRLRRPMCRSGFAARCEARLALPSRALLESGAVPRVRLWLKNFGLSPNPRA